MKKVDFKEKSVPVKFYVTPPGKRRISIMRVSSPARREILEFYLKNALFVREAQKKKESENE